MRVLLKTGRGGECFAALGTRVTPGTDVMGPNVSLEVRWIREDLREERSRRGAFAGQFLGGVRVRVGCCYQGG